MGLIMRRKNECNPSSSGESTEFVEPLAMLMYLLRIAVPELVPASGIMPKPPPQRGAGCNVLGPQIDRSINFCDPAGPKTVYQYSSAIIGASGVVCPF